jgi:hypothetical protein
MATFTTETLIAFNAYAISAGAPYTVPANTYAEVYVLFSNATPLLVSGSTLTQSDGDVIWLDEGDTIELSSGGGGKIRVKEYNKPN